jgi:hypothetical protein
VTLEDILDLYDRLLLNKDTIKRFTVHVSSQKHNKLEPQQQQEQQERGGGGGLEVSAEATSSEATTTSTSANKAEEDDDDDAIPLCREDWKAWNKSMPLLPGVIHLERAKN